MNKTGYIKEKYIEACIDHQSPDKLLKMFEGRIEADFVANHIEHIKECYAALNGNFKVTIIKGLQGTGKSSLLDLIKSSLNDNVYCFYFNCSEINTLDDIFFSLYKNIAKSDFKKDIEIKGAVKNQSIDERIINFLKKIKIPYLFIFDSFENMLGENSEIASEEFENFVNYLSNLPTVKIIAAGRVIFDNTFKINSEYINTIRLQPIDEKQCQKLLKKLNLDVSSHLNYEIYKATKGYPFNIMFFAKAVNKTGISPFDVLKDFSTQKLGIEEFLTKKLYAPLPSNSKRLLWYLCIIRNSLSLTALEKLAPVENLKELINLLQDNLLIVLSKNDIYVKDFIKNLIYELIPNNEKILIHKFYSKCYNENIPLKPFDRFFELSRASLHAEKFYHYTALSRFEKNIQSIGLGLSTNADTQAGMPASEKIKYLSSLSVNADYSDKSVKIPVKQVRQTSINKNSIVASDIEINDENINIENLNLQLSAEEKMLIKDLPNQEISPDTNEIDENEDVGVNKTEFEELIDMAERYELNNEFNIALDFYNQALNVAKNESNHTAKAFVLHKQGVNLHKLSRFEEAYENLQKSKEIYEKINDYNGINLVNLSLGKAYSDNFKYKEAMEYFNSILKNPNHPTNSILTEAIIELADIYEYKQESKKAIEFYNRGLQNSIEVNNKPNLCRIYFKLGLVYDDIVDIEKALENYKKCVQASDSVEINNYLAAAYSNIASIFEEEENINEAISYYKKSLEIDIQISNFHGQHKTLSSLGNLYFDQKDEREALKYFHQEIDAAKMTKDPYYIASAYLEIGDVYLNINNFENALKSYLIARKNIAHTISTDSKEKIERRFHNVFEKVGESKYRDILDKLRKK